MSESYRLISDLRSAIVNNDMDYLEESLLRLGDQAHIMYIWCDLNAMLYAGRLGHLKQAKFLLQDLRRYQEKPGQIREIEKRLFCEAVGNSHLDPDFILELFDSFYCDNKPQLPNWSPMKYLVISNAWTVLEKFILRETERDKKEMYISQMIKFCFENGKRQIFRTSRIFQDEIRSELLKQREHDPLRYAIMEGNAESLEKLLKGREYIYFPCALEFQEVITGRDSYMCNILEIKNNRIPQFLLLVIKLDDVDVFNKLIDSERMTYTLRATRLKSTEEFIDTMLRIASYYESVKIVNDVMDMIPFKWYEFHLRLILAGKFEVAKVVLRLACKSSNVRGYIFNKYAQRQTILRRLPATVPTEVMVKFVDTVESLLKFGPSPTGNWRQNLFRFPVDKGRPDLVKHFKRYGLTYSESTVLRRMNGGRVPVCVNQPYEKYFNPLDLCHLRTFVFNDSVTIDNDFDSDFSEIDDHAFHELSPNGNNALFRACLTHSGSKLRLAYLGERDLQKDKLIQEVNCMQSTTMTLKQLCRSSIRNHIAMKDCIYDDSLPSGNMSVDNGIVDLYIDGYIPKVLTFYLLYRDYDKYHALYHRLNSVFVHKYIQ